VKELVQELEKKEQLVQEQVTSLESYLKPKSLGLVEEFEMVLGQG